MLNCYPQPGKARSRQVLEAFAAGAGGRIAQGRELKAGAAAFWGVVGLEYLLRQASAEQRTFYYGDNSYFDCTRQTHFRFARNALQPSTLQPQDQNRAQRIGIKISPWRRTGSHIVLVEQSDHYLRLSGAHPMWAARTVAELRRHTQKPIRIRHWMSDKQKAGASLPLDLENAWALITHGSAAANEAILAGVPVFVTMPCAATPMASGALDRIESPLYPDGREDWAAGLAGMQWTIDEIKSGMAWAKLSG